MNKIVEQTKKINEYQNYIPELEVGEVVEINDVWDGEGDFPEDSYSYKLNDNTWINYEFKIIEKQINPLGTVIKITNIELV